MRHLSSEGAAFMLFKLLCDFKYNNFIIILEILFLK